MKTASLSKPPRDRWERPTPSGSVSTGMAVTAQRSIVGGLGGLGQAFVSRAIRLRGDDFVCTSVRAGQPHHFASSRSCFCHDALPPIFEIAGVLSATAAVAPRLRTSLVE